MNRILFFLFCLFFGAKSFSQIPVNYYSTAAGISGTPLRQALHDIIDNHSTQSYSSLWNHVGITDRKPNGKVWDIYSDIPGGTPPYEYTFFSNQCGNISVEGSCYNREHSWPQSWFNSSPPMQSDLFHIYPTDGKVNGLRGNFPFGEVTTPTNITLNGSKLGPCTFPGYASTVFEPINEYKGDLARSYFYMVTRYFNEDAGWQTTAATTGANLKPWQLDQLKKWALNDPVSAKEINRNNAIYGIQNNRNPFIDSPQFICRIFPGNYCTAGQTSLATTTGGIQNICLGNEINIPFTLSGQVQSGNIFTVELSNSSGSFSNPIIIGTLNSTFANSVNSKIPLNVSAGTGYRIRVNASNPLVIGADNGVNLTILPSMSVSLGADLRICAGDSVLLTAFGANTYAWNNTAQTASIKVAPSQTTAYIVFGTALSGCTDFDTIIVTVDPAPNSPIITLNGSILTSNNPDFQTWYLNNVEIQGENGSTLNLFQSGNYYSKVLGANNCYSQKSNVINYIVSGIGNLDVNQFKIFPNPSDDIFYIENDEKFSLQEISIINMLGQIVYTLNLENTRENKITIDISNQDAGVYHVLLKTQNGFGIKKLIIQ